MRVTNYMALKAHMGDWEYYVTTMRAEDVVSYVRYAEEINPKPELDSILQRGLAKRSEKIADFLKNNTERFFGALIIAVYGGNPKFKCIDIEGAEMLGVGNPNMGVLQFDGREKYYVLDGQHRVAALRTLKESDGFFAELESELISVILISHPSDTEGIKRARRLFTNLNRYAVRTNKGVNVALEEDDGYAIVTRRLVREFPYFQTVTKIAKQRRDGGYDLITGEALNAKADTQWLLTLPTFYECNKHLLGGVCQEEFGGQQQRPDERHLSSAYAKLEDRWSKILSTIGAFQFSSVEPRCFERGGEDGGHPLIRPIGLRAFTMAAGDAFDDEIHFSAILNAGNRDESLSDAPWSGLLWNQTTKRMEAGKARMKVAADVYRIRMGIQIDKERVRRELEGFGSEFQVT